MTAYEYGGEIDKNELNRVFIEIDKPEDENVLPFFEDHLDATRKAAEALVPVLGSAKAKVSINVTGTVNPGHCADNDGGLESISITISVVEDLYADPDLIPEDEQTHTDPDLYTNALTTEKPVSEEEKDKDKDKDKDPHPDQTLPGDLEDKKPKPKPTPLPAKKK